MKAVLLALAFVAIGASAAQAQGIGGMGTGYIDVATDPTGSEAYRTTQDPGWWQRTFVGWDQNGDGQYTGGERGVLPLAIDGVIGLCWSLTRPIIDRLLDSVPNDRIAAFAGYFAGIGYYFKIANAWLPIDYATVLLVSFYSFQGAFWAIKMVLKVIPFVG